MFQKMAVKRREEQEEKKKTNKKMRKKPAIMEGGESLRGISCSRRRVKKKEKWSYGRTIV